MTGTYLSIPVIFAVVLPAIVSAENVSVFNISTDEVVVASLNKSHEEDSEFPEDLFTEEQRRNGAIIFHIILAVYCFAAIATVCTEYFMPTIACICRVLKLSDDVAAATFMSIATSSPELFTNIIGTFITGSDIGVGHVLGNAYYDMFFVAALGGLAASKEIVLDWWPIARDCSIYLVVACCLTWAVWDGKVEVHECLVLLALYVLYFVIMFGNRAIIRFLKNKCGVNIIDPVDEITTDTNSDGTGETMVPEDSAEALHGPGYTIVPTIVPVDGEKGSIQETPQVQTEIKSTGIKKWLTRVGKLVILPLRILMAITIPDVKKHRWRNMYPVSFVMCVCWIGVSTYLGTWMISTIGKCIGVPDIIMGMVFMAAGGSVVEAYGVFYKARRGDCSYGLSNSMGCNTLDATMCLALPWLVKILINNSYNSGPSAIMMASDALHVNCSLLIISVVLIFLILLANRFKMNWKSGLVAGIAYVTVLTIAIFAETKEGSPES